jgi:hypothetical protein
MCIALGSRRLFLNPATGIFVPFELAAGSAMSATATYRGRETSNWDDPLIRSAYVDLCQSINLGGTVRRKPLQGLKPLCPVDHPTLRVGLVLEVSSGQNSYALGSGMTHWTASVVAILLAGFPGVASAQVNCEAIPHGPARTDCYLGLSQFYRGQSDLAAARARVQSDAARYRAIAGTDPPKHRQHRRR